MKYLIHQKQKPTKPKSFENKDKNYVRSRYEGLLLPPYELKDRFLANEENVLNVYRTIATMLSSQVPTLTPKWNESYSLPRDPFFSALEHVSSMVPVKSNQDPDAKPRAREQGANRELVNAVVNHTILLDFSKTGDIQFSPGDLFLACYACKGLVRHSGYVFCDAKCGAALCMDCLAKGIGPLCIDPDCKASFDLGNEIYIAYYDLLGVTSREKCLLTGAHTEIQTRLQPCTKCQNYLPIESLFACSENCSNITCYNCFCNVKGRCFSGGQPHSHKAVFFPTNTDPKECPTCKVTSKFFRCGGPTGLPGTIKPNPNSNRSKRRAKREAPKVCSAEHCPHCVLKVERCACGKSLEKLKTFLLNARRNIREECAKCKESTLLGSLFLLGHQNSVKWCDKCLQNDKRLSYHYTIKRNLRNTMQDLLNILDGLFVRLAGITRSNKKAPTVTTRRETDALDSIFDGVFLPNSPRISKMNIHRPKVNFSLLINVDSPVTPDVSENGDF